VVDVESKGKHVPCILRRKRSQGDDGLHSVSVPSSDTRDNSQEIIFFFSLHLCTEMAKYYIVEKGHHAWAAGAMAFPYLN
jgi:hypothetical protein